MADNDVLNFVRTYIHMRLNHSDSMSDVIKTSDIRDALDDKTVSFETIQNCMRFVAKDEFLRQDILGNILIG